ncbi:hypothetical protein [Streptomyces longispororuber]|uniref:hypothetical protein n=1 Tax=Streptomyces longispororuber TaxID=68230 RepID=UPI0036F81B59
MADAQEQEDGVINGCSLAHGTSTYHPQTEGRGPGRVTTLGTTPPAMPPVTANPATSRTR